MTADPKAFWLNQFNKDDTAIFDETLQEAEFPIIEMNEALKSKGRLAVIVPNEYAWPPELKPFTNTKHKRVYDADLLAEHLDAIGCVYVLGLVEFNGWSWITAEATKA